MVLEFGRRDIIGLDFKSATKKKLSDFVIKIIINNALAPVYDFRNLVQTASVIVVKVWQLAWPKETIT